MIKLKRILIFTFFLLGAREVSAQDFTGIVKYKLTVLGSTDNNTDSMLVVFDKDRVMVILYLPDDKKVSERVYIDNFHEKKSYTIDRDKHTFHADTLKTGTGYTFTNTNSIGAVNNDLCIRYKADLTNLDRSRITAAECLAGINYRNSYIKNYSFFGSTPLIVDNRIVLDFTVTNTNGTRPKITVADTRRLDNADSYFDLKGYTETR